MEINILNSNDGFKNDLDEKEIERISFDDEILGEEIVSFDFADSSEKDFNISKDSDLKKDIKNINISENIGGSKSQDRLIPLSQIHKNKFFTNTGLMKNLNGAAHIIDGETPDSRRSYNLRSSTVRKISELKSIHPDINICVSTIVDLAVDYYYYFIMEK